jgi:exopolyphosphatase/guanosine-5'-triphosphate,3'-diphosphate pyrophosphatase
MPGTVRQPARVDDAIVRPVMPAFASIDVGSNASRLLIAEADEPSGIRYVDGMRVPVRLGHAVFLTGRLDAQAIEQCIEALRQFRAHLEARPVSALRAVVTASARDAVNADELLERAREEAGVELEAISGTEEARLVKLAVESRLALEGARALLVDLGGGSLELSEVHHDEVRYSTSLEIGTVRLLESFLSSKKPVTEAQEKLLGEYIDRMLAPVEESFRRRSYDIVAGTGGNFETLAQLCPVPGRALPTIDVRAARALLGRLRKMTPAERRAAHDLRADRADVIVPALYVMLRVADLARTEEIVAPGVGLKEGILVELVDKHFRVWDYAVDEHAMARAAVQLGRRYHFDEPHATQVDRLCCVLFDSLEPLHGLGPVDRQMLRAAALLHDIGDFISSDAHHKHTQYIIESTDVMGLSREHRQIVACVARYHRRAMPSPNHASYKKLSPTDRKRVRKLASILRVADALDRGHRSKVRSLDVQVGAEEVAIVAKGAGDLALEVWTARRKAELFERTFDRTLRFDLA